MRNINLPRHEDDGTPAWEGALSGIMALASRDTRAELGGITGEIRNILARYQDHKKQLRQQLEENFALQTAQLQQNLAQQTGMQMKISPAQHPEFQKEWQKVMEQMNDQYLNALEQYKDAIYKILAVDR
jgi:CRISPR/Cas system CSM-associated protein Csm2 small subunit